MKIFKKLANVDHKFSTLAVFLVLPKQKMALYDGPLWVSPKI